MTPTSTGNLQMQVSLLEAPFPLGSDLDVGNKSVTPLGPDIPSCTKSDIIPKDKPSVSSARSNQCSDVTQASEEPTINVSVSCLMADSLTSGAFLTGPEPLVTASLILEGRSSAGEIAKSSSTCRSRSSAMLDDADL